MPIDTAMAGTRTAYRTCPLCEAGCGLAVTVSREADGRERVERVRGDHDDVFSKGFLCPKGTTLKQLHEDPDRLRRPLVKRDGVFVETTWDEAFAEIERRLSPIIERAGRDAVAVYIGNPTGHHLSGTFYLRSVVKGLGTKNVYTAATVDQRPKEIAVGLMFGTGAHISVPDIDRTSFLITFGSNPYASNGSGGAAPDWPGRIEAMRARGGRLVVVDPRRTRTADVADEWIAIRPGADALMLAAMVRTLLDEGLADLGSVAPYVDRFELLRPALAPFGPDDVAAATGVDADTIRRLAREIAAAPSAAVHGRVGTTLQEYGTVASWLIDVLNICSGHFDQPGGSMFTTPAIAGETARGAGRFGRGIAGRIGYAATRVRGLPATLGEFPAACLAEEIDTPGEGQIKALVCVAGNPVLSIPNAGGRLDAALAGLEFMVSVDIYRNETSRHADVILPPQSTLERPHYDVGLLQFALRNVANWSEPVFPIPEGQLDEWRILAKLGLIAQGAGADADPDTVDDALIDGLVRAAVADKDGPLFGRDPEELLVALSARRGPDRIVDFYLRSGLHGDHFGQRKTSARSAGAPALSLDVLLQHPHGVDLGPLEPRVPDVLRTPNGMIDIAPQLILDDLQRLEAALHRNDDRIVLIGRRDVRSCNSWMHNVEVLVRGKPRCTLHIHPDDAAGLGLRDGEPAKVCSRTGEVVVPVEITDAIRRGVVSLPHGWGHDLDGVELGVARRHAGVNSNLLADETLLDAPSGTAALNGIPVTIAPASSDQVIPVGTSR